jgi:hypothetical protein
MCHCEGATKGILPQKLGGAKEAWAVEKQADRHVVSGEIR